MIPSHIAAFLQRSADAVVDRVCKRQMGLMIHAPKLEIDFVASFVENGAPLLQRLWRRALAPAVTLQIAGVFTHKSPIVTVQGTAPRPVNTYGCELADLLVLHSHRTTRGKVFMRGVLMQTKIDNGGSFKPGDPQFWLYDTWPHFVVRSPGFHRQPRDFNGDRRSGYYGLVSSGGWLVTPPISPMAPTSPGTYGLGSFLVKMLYDIDPAQPGRMSMFGRQVYHNEKKDWSATIMELVEKTGLRPFRHTGAYSTRMPRIGGNVLYLMQDNPVLIGRDGRGEALEKGRGLGVFVIATEDEGARQH